MGHLIRLKTRRLIAFLAVVLSMVFTAPWMAGTENSFAAQTIPAITKPAPMARDAATFELDKEVNHACRKSKVSANKTEREACLCVTFILKYELTLPQYKAAARLYGTHGNNDQIYQDLRKAGVTQSDIGTAERLNQSLALAPDFEKRCTIAKAYYK